MCCLYWQKDGLEGKGGQQTVIQALGILSKQKSRLMLFIHKSYTFAEIETS